MVMAVSLRLDVILPPVAEMSPFIDFLPRRQLRMRWVQMRKVAVVVQDGVEPFGLGVDLRGLGRALPPRGRQPGLRLRGRHAPPRARCRGPSGFDLHVEHGLDAAEDADLICVAPKRDFLEPSPEVAALLPARRRPRCDDLRALHRRVHAGRGRPARRAARAPPTGATSTSSRRRYPRGQGRLRRALRRRTATSPQAPAPPPASTPRCT